MVRIPGSKITDAKCYCGDASQTPEHLLLKCPKYKDQREKLHRKVKQRNRSITIKTLLHTRKGISATESFLESTKIGTRHWLHSTSNIRNGDDPESNWNGINTGWGRLQNEHGGEEGEEGKEGEDG
jgi:hypothetical protein